jgi:hypothetical protein
MPPTSSGRRCPPTAGSSPPCRRGCAGRARSGTD